MSEQTPNPYLLSKGSTDKIAHLNATTSHVAILQIPTPVGVWVIGNVQFTAQKRPRWLTRKLMKLLLELEWRDL